MRKGLHMRTPPTRNSFAASASVRRSGLFIGNSSLPSSRRIVRRATWGQGASRSRSLDQNRLAAHDFVRPTPQGGKGLTTTKGGTMKARHSLACIIAALSLVALHARADSDRDRERDRDRDRTTTVDCAAGDTVARALTRGDERKSLTILINGSCSEHVVINRSDIKLAAAAPGATISGPDPAIDVIRVTGTRVTLDGITVTGGRNGITADGAAGLIVQNALVQGSGRNGITYAHGASGVVDGCRVLNNARDGVAVDAASGSVINSQVSQNARMGVGVFNGGTARIGIDNFNVARGNTISANGVNGIHIVYGSTALVAANQVTGNGTDPSAAFSGNGVNIANATANVIGGNTISGNAGPGINLRSGSVNLGDANFDMSTVNTITGNGNPTFTGDGVDGRH